MLRVAAALFPCFWAGAGAGEGAGAGLDLVVEIELHATAARSTRAGASMRVERMDPPGKGRGLLLGGRKRAPALSDYPTLIYRIAPQSRRTI